MFKNHQLCILQGSVRENMIRELHSGGLVGHFNIDKTKALVEEKCYCLRLATDVKKWIQLCKNCQHSKG